MSASPDRDAADPRPDPHAVPHSIGHAAWPGRPDPSGTPDPDALEPQQGPDVPVPTKRSGTDAPDT